MHDQQNPPIGLAAPEAHVVQVAQQDMQFGRSIDIFQVRGPGAVGPLVAGGIELPELYRRFGQVLPEREGDRGSLSKLR